MQDSPCLIATVVSAYQTLVLCRRQLIYEHCSPGLFLRNGVKSTSLTFEVEVETVELTRWLLLPRGRKYASFQLIRYETGKPENPEKVSIVTRYLAEDDTILAF